jgi:two-component system, NarL family, response regulator DegU
MKISKVQADQVRIFLAEPHPVTLQGLRLSLAAPDIEIVGEARSGREAIAGILSSEPNVVVVEVNLPDLNGLEVLRRVKAAAPGVAIIIFTAFKEPSYLLEAVMSGAVGYLLKDSDGHEVLDMVRRVAIGENGLPREVWEDLMTKFQADRMAHLKIPGERLSRREIQILECIALGKSNNNVATTLGLTPNTVRFYIKHIFEKLNVCDRTEAVVCAIREGLITVPSKVR